MKFEKFLKAVGTHGEVIVRNESEKWLVCDGVGMVIPRGVDNLLGKSVKSDRSSAADILSGVEYDDPLTLTRAIMTRADGKASDIVRVFETADKIDEIGITNADFGLLEKRDLLGYSEIVIDCDKDGDPLPEGEEKTVKYVVVFDLAHNVVGYITGVD
jgi:hypothetical protein